jgi:hypothetical protein
LNIWLLLVAAAVEQEIIRQTTHPAAVAGALAVF